MNVTILYGILLRGISFRKWIRISCWLKPFILILISKTQNLNILLLKLWFTLFLISNWNFFLFTCFWKWNQLWIQLFFLLKNLSLPLFISNKHKIIDLFLQTYQTRTNFIILNLIWLLLWKKFFDFCTQFINMILRFFFIISFIFFLSIIFKNQLLFNFTIFFKTFYCMSYTFSLFFYRLIYQNLLILFKCIKLNYLFPPPLI